MKLKDYMEQKKAQVEWLAQDVILSKKLMIFGIVLAVIGLAAAITGTIFGGFDPDIPENGNFLFLAPILKYAGWPIFGLGMLFFVWRLVMILTKVQVKRYAGMKGFLASGFDEKINTVVYRKCFKNLVHSYLDIDGLVTKKEKTGNVRYLYHELGSDLDLMKHVKQPAPEANSNAILKPVAVAPAAPAAAQPAAAPAPAAPQKDHFEDLKKLKDLLDAGIINEKEYEEKKAEILKKL